VTPSAEAPENRVVSQIRVRAFLFLLLAIVAGGGAVVLFKQYLDRVRGAGKTTGPVAHVVVASVNIPIASRLDEKQLALIEWPKESVPEGAFTALKDVVGQTVQTNLVKGEPVLKERLADEAEGRGLAALLADGMRAMAVRVDSVVGVAGFVKPGDYVDVLTTMSPDEETQTTLAEQAARVSKIILQNVLVLAVGEHLSTEGNKPVKVQVVTLGVTPEESEKLALSSTYGRLTLTLRSRIDQKLAATAGVAPVDLLAPDDQVGTRVEPEKPRRTFRTQRVREEPKPAAPAAPVVEILRGNKIEERTLRVPSQNP
jgi:pilus assembly protein CpaB